MFSDVVKRYGRDAILRGRARSLAGSHPLYQVPIDRPFYTRIPPLPTFPRRDGPGKYTAPDKKNAFRITKQLTLN